MRGKKRPYERPVLSCFFIFGLALITSVTAKDQYEKDRSPLLERLGKQVLRYVGEDSSITESIWYSDKHWSALVTGCRNGVAWRAEITTTGYIMGVEKAYPFTVCI